MIRKLTVTAALLFAASTVFAQVEGPVKTDILVAVSSKGSQIPAISDVRLKVNGKEEALSGWVPAAVNGGQVAILIDEGLRQSIGTELNSLSSFVKELPEGTQVFVGYMRNGSVLAAQSFTTDLPTAANSFRLPIGSAGISGSPYFCLSDFVKRWPANSSRPGARFVLMITNGVDPYNGSTSILNQDSPYVQAAILDAQKAGVSVSSIYYGDRGFRGGSASFSGQSYLAQLSDQTGGRAYYEGTGNPVSVAPYLSQFRKMLTETYVASFTANASSNKLLRVDAQTSLHNVKLRSSQYVMPGNVEVSPAE